MPSRSANDPWLAELANGIARHYKDLYGRGPTTVRLHVLGEDAILCVLEGTESPAERTLREVGHARRVRETRTMIQFARKEQLCALVEGVTGKRVRSYVSGLNAEDDTATELFLLEGKPPA